MTESGKAAAPLKRKSGQYGADGEPSKKRSKAEKHEEKPRPVQNAEDDPVRKYCLGKLKGIVVLIFLGHQKDVAESDNATGPPLNPQGDEVSDEVRKTEAEGKAAAFTGELEQCVFEVASELDKKGRKIAGPKYK